MQYIYATRNALLNGSPAIVAQTTFAQLLRNEGYQVRDEDVARLSPFVYKRHINLLGRYSFAVPEAVSRGKLRPLRNPDDPDA